MQRKPGDWDCPQCGSLNFASRNECRDCKCYKSKANPVEKKKGDWNCSCGELNFASRNNCRRCDKAKAQNSGGFMNWLFNGPNKPPVLQQIKNNVDLTPIKSGILETINNTIQPKKPVDLTSIKPGDWLCDQCQTNNFGTRVVCFNCGKNKDKQIETEEKEDELCGVCLSSPTDTCITVCGHLFCNFCALNCNKCPKCRKDYTAGDLIKIYK